jgi:hypothetical protein
MMHLIVIGLCVFGVALLVFLHYRSKRAQQSKLIETLGNAAGVVSLVLALYLAYDASKQPKKPEPESFIVVTCTAPPSETQGVSEQKRRWLTKEAAEINCRSKLVMAIKAQLQINIKQNNGEMTNKDVELKTNVALQLSEIVDGKFLPDGTYEMKMKVPRPVV